MAAVLTLAVGETLPASSFIGSLEEYEALNEGVAQFDKATVSSAELGLLALRDIIEENERTEDLLATLALVRATYLAYFAEPTLTPSQVRALYTETIKRSSGFDLHLGKVLDITLKDCFQAWEASKAAARKAKPQARKAPRRSTSKPNKAQTHQSASNGRRRNGRRRPTKPVA